MPLGAASHDQIDLAVGHPRRVALQFRPEESKDGSPQIFPVGVSSDADDGIDRGTFAVQAIEPLESIDDSLIGVHGKDAVLITVHEAKGAGSHQGGNARPRPLERVV